MCCRRGSDFGLGLPAKATHPQLPVTGPNPKHWGPTPVSSSSVGPSSVEPTPTGVIGHGAQPQALGARVGQADLRTPEPLGVPCGITLFLACNGCWRSHSSALAHGYFLHKKGARCFRVVYLRTVLYL
uniref:Uncharacterized protein n=1 Tax=Eutreptiella gymnastica TaxID=73025 RepID=A0A7S1JE67_9EUGL